MILIIEYSNKDDLKVRDSGIILQWEYFRIFS